MNVTWEYKVVTLKHGGGGLKLSLTPTDDEAAAALTRKGALGRDRVNAICVNAICVGPAQPTMLYFKRRH